MMCCLPSALSMPLGAHPHGVVEALQRSVSVSRAVLVQGVDHGLHDLRHGVVAGEVVAGEQRVEDGPGDEVLGEHLDGVVAADGVVEVVSQRGEELARTARRPRSCCGRRGGR